MIVPIERLLGQVPAHNSLFRQRTVVVVVLVIATAAADYSSQSESGAISLRTTGKVIKSGYSISQWNLIGNYGIGHEDKTLINWRSPIQINCFIYLISAWWGCDCGDVCCLLR